MSNYRIFPFWTNDCVKAKEKVCRPVCCQSKSISQTNTPWRLILWGRPRDSIIAEKKKKIETNLGEKSVSLFPGIWKGKQQESEIGLGFFDHVPVQSSSRPWGKTILLETDFKIKVFRIEKRCMFSMSKQILHLVENTSPRFRWAPNFFKWKIKWSENVGGRLDYYLSKLSNFRSSYSEYRKLFCSNNAISSF